MAAGLASLAAAALTAAAPAAPATAPVDAPKVVSTDPGLEDVVPPGERILTVTFDRPMQATWSFVTHDGLAFPEVLGNPVLGADQRTIAVRVKLAPDTRYGVMLNSARFSNFRDLDGRSATPHRLTFKTSSGPAAPHH